MKKDFIDIRGTKDRPVFALFIILSLEVIIAYIISSTNKSDNILVHLMYVPIILASFIFDVKIGVLSSIIAELLIDVFTPAKIGLYDIQLVYSSILRVVFFLIAGLTVSFIKKQKDDEQPSFMEGEIVHPYTKLPYWDSFNKYTKSIIHNKEIIQFRFFLIEFNNQNELLATFSFNTINQINQIIITRIETKYKKCKLFFVRLNTLGLFLPDIHQDISELIQLFEEPILVNGIPVYCEITIGEASYPENGHTPENLLRNSYLALNEAKQHQKPYQLYNSKLLNPETPILLGQFQVAIQSKQVDFHYQPIIHRNGMVCALEALVRWKHPIRGIIPPDDFIPDLEFTRIANHLTYYSIDTNISRMKLLFKAGINLDISLNISITNLFQPDFAKKVIEIIEKHKFPAHHMILEITERGFLSDDNECRRTLDILINYGIKISMDDFGVGFTSISNFCTQGITSIKIDKSFIRGIHTNKNNQAILEGLVSIAKSSDIMIIAEGIEEIPEKEKILDLGFDCLQGYLISRPLDFRTIKKWLLGYQKKPA